MLCVCVFFFLLHYKCGLCINVLHSMIYHALSDKVLFSYWFFFVAFVMWVFVCLFYHSHFKQWKKIGDKSIFALIAKTLNLFKLFIETRFAPSQGILCIENLLNKFILLGAFVKCFHFYLDFCCCCLFVW